MDIIKYLWLKEIGIVKPLLERYLKKNAIKKSALTKEQILNKLSDEVSKCRKCRLCEHRNKTVFGYGSIHNPKWMIVGEAPGMQEDKSGYPFVGQSGELLDNMLSSLGLTREKDVYITNIIKCRPPKNRDPFVEELASCLPYLWQQVKLIRPKLIFALGRFSAHMILSTQKSISSLRCHIHKLHLEDIVIPVVVSYHPAYLLRRPEEKFSAWKDLYFALNHINQIS